MVLVDTHTHLYLPEFENDLGLSIDRAINAGVRYMYIPNIDHASIKPMLLICNQYPKYCFPMLGMHPTSVKENFKEELSNICDYIHHTHFVAIGEIGIDLYWDKTHLSEQVEAFRIQLDLALEHNLPVVIHCRDAYQVIMNVLNDYRDKPLHGVFHAFSGPKENAQEIIKRGFLLGIGGVLTYKNSKLGDVIAHIPLQHLVLETDAPYLTPVPKRGERNESAYVNYVCQKIADLQQVDPEEVARITTANALSLFKHENRIFNT
jgi:TatD DNase family protein